ncbi:monocyte chemotactic protein 1B-like [Garra rufa]|uniref:monocyte chemotactic protein 1B-like n=1 Tax=Garra rufa TaxID=137080 RepID=UPI003CCEB483
MRSLMSVLFLVIFFSVQMTSATSAIEVTNIKCCLEFSNVKIPVKLVTSYYWTSTNCARRAIVFKTIAGREFCVDPETTWVSGHVDKVDKKPTTARTTTVSASTTATTA